MVTQKKIAEVLGVSQSTVANILRGAPAPKYSEETRAAVLEAAQRLGYRPNRSAQAIQRGRSNLIGVIHFGAGLEISGKVADNLPSIISRHGYLYMVVDLRWYGGRVEQIIQEMINARVEGVIIAHISGLFGPQHAEVLIRAGIPVISLFGDARLNIPVIRDDVKSAFREVTEHLLKVGHRKIVAVLGSSDTGPMRDRRAGIEAAFKGKARIKVLHGDEACFKESLIFEDAADQPEAVIARVTQQPDDFNFRTSVYKFASMLFRSGVRPDAIICSNDSAALGAYCAAHEQGLRIPQDLALTGCDDDAMGELPIFKFTTIRKSLPEACSAAVELLIKWITSGIKPSVEERLLNSEIILRESCGRLLAPKNI